MTPSQAAAVLDVNAETVRRWLRAFDANGESFFEADFRRGKPPTRLSSEQVDWLREAILGRTPRDFGYESPLWTLREMRAVLKSQFGITVPISTLHVTIQRAGLRPRVPQKRATERDDAEVDSWMKNVWPEIVGDALLGAKVFFLDEAGVRADAPLARTWSQRGKRPVVRTSGKRPRVNVISAVTWDGDLSFGTYTGTLNAERFVEFLKLLLASFAGALVVVLDGNRFHFAPAVRAFLSSDEGGRLKLVRLPAYAPDLNPDEHCWSHLKGQLRRYPIKPGESIADVVADEMLQIGANRHLVRSFFGHPDVSYLHAAARVGAM
jgi:transposase